MSDRPMNERPITVRWTMSSNGVSSPSRSVAGARATTAGEDGTQ
jgi:hypothetical protein